MKNKTTYNRSMHNSDHPYTMISADLINNTDLNGEEKILLISLLSNSDNYILHSTYLAKNAKESLGWGRDKYQKHWNNLQAKGYIVKKQIFENRIIAGYHYFVHESLNPEILNSRSPELQCPGKPVPRKTSALISINETNINQTNTDEPNSACGYTKTNLNGESTIPAGGSGILETNDQVKQIFDLICELNPEEQSNKWKMNDQDRKLIKKAIDKLGFMEAKVRVYQLVDEDEKKPYYSVAYIFSDFKEEKPTTIGQNEEVESLLKDQPEAIDSFTDIAFSDEKVEQAQLECEDEYQFFDFIQTGTMEIHSDAKHWKPSEKDLEHCERLMDCDSNIPLAEKLRNGLKSAFQKNDWRFGQIVYQAVAAVETKELLYS